MTTRSRWGPDENLIQSIPNTVFTTVLSLTVGCGILVWLAVVVPTELLVSFLAAAVAVFGIGIGPIVLQKLVVRVIER